MANLTLTRQDTKMVIASQDFCVSLQDTWENQKVLFIVLRALTSSHTGKPLFTYQQLVDVFGYAHRQNIQNFWQEFEQAEEDFLRSTQNRHGSH